MVFREVSGWVSNRERGRERGLGLRGIFRVVWIFVRVDSIVFFWYRIGRLVSGREKLVYRVVGFFIVLNVIFRKSDIFIVRVYLVLLRSV